MTIAHEKNSRPAILAPAGNRKAFLAAIAAGADAVYCGLKHFSARMEAENFTLDELSQLVSLAHAKDIEVYIALNTLVKPDEIDIAAKLMDQLNRYVRPDAIIIQDLSFIDLARQVGFQGELHLSTLANVSFPAALKMIAQTKGISRVVIPRELHIDEIKAMAAACPEGMGVEVFVHGALCYGVSGRCYWSSLMGGKSGLRGRCVQPCRRVYQLKDLKKRYFSCNDLSLDVLAKVLLSEMKIRAWKIEGRRKSAHYVYNTVTAYRLFRDHAGDPGMKKAALDLLENAFGRKGTHYNFLPQRPQLPISTETQTASGLMIGNIKGPVQQQYLSPRDPLFKGDFLRIGYEDEAWHRTYRVTKSVPKKGRLVLKFPLKNTPRTGTPVFLLDRKGEELENLIKALETDLGRIPFKSFPQSNFKPVFSKQMNVLSGKRSERAIEQHVERKIGKGRKTESSGYWLSIENVAGMPKKGIASSWCWLPPVLFPDDEKETGTLVESVLQKGGTRFVLNAPWQTAFFNRAKGTILWAGPFCNISNSFAIGAAASMGFSGVIVSPELGERDYVKLSRQSPLPLGIVLSGNWPLCISRTLAGDMKIQTSFASPKNEEAWVEKHGSLYWIFPNWKLDLTTHKEMLFKAGYRFFVHLSEPVPKGVSLKKRQGLWNWKVGIL